MPSKVAAIGSSAAARSTKRSASAAMGRTRHRPGVPSPAASPRSSGDRHRVTRRCRRTYSRHGWPRSAPHGGSGVGDRDVVDDREHDPRRMGGARGRCSFGDRARRAASAWKAHRGRLPPGACTTTRIREPARKTCPNGNTGTRTSDEASRAAAGRRRHRRVRRHGQRARSRPARSSARWLARSQPLCT